MGGMTFITEGDGKLHSIQERGVVSVYNQAVTLVQLPQDVGGNKPSGAGPLVVGMSQLEIPLALQASITYPHSDPVNVVWSDLGQQLCLSVVWSDDNQYVNEPVRVRLVR